MSGAGEESSAKAASPGSSGGGSGDSAPGGRGGPPEPPDDEAKARAPARRLSAADLARLSDALRAQVDAQAPLPPGLAALAEDVKAGRLEAAVAALRSDLEAGTPLSQAVARQGDALPAGFAALLAAGEAAGDPALGVDLLAEQAAADADLEHTTRAALAQPLVAAAVGLLVLGGVVLFAVPPFAEIYRNMGLELPAPTALLVSTGGRGLAFVAALALIALALGAGPRTLARLVAGRFSARRLSTLWHVLGGFVSRGVPLPVALRALAAGEPGGDAVLARVAERLETGDTLAQALEPEGAFPHAQAWLLGAAEERGCLTEALADLSERAERRHETTVRFAEALAGPLALLIVGFGVGGVVLTVFLPIFDLQKSLQ